MTEPDLVIARCDIQRHLERRRAVGADHTTGRPEVHRVRRRRDRHLPHRATGDDVPRLQVAGPGTRGISGARAISAQPWLDSGERDDDQGRRREGGKVAAEHALRHRARRTVSRPPLGGVGSGAAHATRLRATPATRMGDQLLTDRVVWTAARQHTRPNAKGRRSDAARGCQPVDTRCSAAAAALSRMSTVGSVRLVEKLAPRRAVPGNASQRAVQLPDIRRPQPQRRQRPAIVRRQTAPGASRRVVRIRHAQAGSHARAAQRSRQGATEGYLTEKKRTCLSRVRASRGELPVLSRSAQRLACRRGAGHRHRHAPKEARTALPSSLPRR